MSWELRFAPRARRDLRNIPTDDADRIVARLIDASRSPGNADLRKLAGQGNRWRLRVGRWRVALGFDNATGTMTVLRVLPRDRAYR